MIYKKWFAIVSLLVILVLLLPIGTIAQGSQLFASLPRDGDPSFSNYPNPSSGSGTQIASAAATLGEPGLNFRYVETFGETEMAYFTDTLHINSPFGLGTDGTDVWIADSDGGRVLKCASGGSCGGLPRARWRSSARRANASTLAARRHGSAARSS